MLEFRYPMLVNVMIGSPAMVGNARDAIQSEIEEWNVLHSADRSVVLMPYRWENRTPAIIGYGRAQDVIDTRLVDNAHIMFAVFHHRFGTPTGKFGSGTEEEVDRALELGLRVHLLFSAEKADLESIEPDQLDAVRQYRSRMMALGVVRDYSDIEQLRAAVRLALNDDISYFRLAHREAVAGHDGTALRVSYDSPSESIIVRNDGTGPVDRLIVSSVTVAGAPATVSLMGVEVTLRPGGMTSYHFFSAPGVGKSIHVAISWRGDSGNTRSAILQL
jgi:hypothetical protein